jgi:hypothetical protein
MRRHLHCLKRVFVLAVTSPARRHLHCADHGRATVPSKPAQEVAMPRSKKIIIVALASLIMMVTVAGLAKWTMFATSAAMSGTATANVSPFELMLKTDAKKLPPEEIKGGECPDHC